MRADDVGALEETAARFRALADRAIGGRAGEFERSGRVAEDTVRALGEAGLLGSLLPAGVGGGGFDHLTYGLLTEALGRLCSSTRSLLTVHDMVAHGVARWGTEEAKAELLPDLARGIRVGAFCLTESGSGSDPDSLEASAEPVDGGRAYRIDGVKRWVTHGWRADLFLVFARVAGRPAGFAIDRASPGLTTTPVTGLLGLRGSAAADVTLRGCEVPAARMLGEPGFGLSGVASSCLDLGRYSVAWGCVGMAGACADASVRHALSRRQAGGRLSDRQLVRRLIADMVVDVRAARLLCLSAGRLRDAGERAAFGETHAAKYFASRAAFRAAAAAVQIHGAQGCTDRHPVERFLRDAKIMEIIEGSTEVEQDTIAALRFMDEGDQ